jgi:hypothetical protein
MDGLDDVPITTSVPEFGEIVYGLGRSGSYEAAKPEFRLTRRHMQKIQDKGRRSRWDAMTPAQRSEYARNLNKIRWHGAKAQNKNGRRAAP